MAEFKKLSAVEAVNTVSDTASVLIEEDGVIKKAPKGEVGGVKVASTAEVGQTIVVKAVDESGNPTEWECADMAKGEEPDMVITVNNESNAVITDGTWSITEGNVVDVITAIRENRYPDVRIRFAYSDGYIYDNREIIASAHIYGEWLYVGYMLNHMSSNYIFEGYIRFNTDGTFHSAKLKKVATTVV